MVTSNTESLETRAERAKHLGNAAFVKDRYSDAVSHYSEAIKLSPKEHAVYYGYTLSNSQNILITIETELHPI
jgi:cytochrome c-type biogenesis protein CcmH/NrfG